MTVKAHKALFSVLFLLMSGCAYERNLKLDARLTTPPAVKQLPLRMGVFYSPEFANYTKKLEMYACGPYGRRDKTDIFFIFPIGTSSRDLFDQVTASMFASVTSSSVSFRSLENRAPLDGVLEPRVESFSWQITCSKDFFSTGKMEARVSYAIDLYDCSSGQLVTSLHVEGLGARKPELCFKDCRDSIATEMAMQDAMAKFMTDFYERPEVRQWLSTHVAPHDKRQ